MLEKKRMIGFASLLSLALVGAGTVTDGDTAAASGQDPLHCGGEVQHVWPGHGFGAHAASIGSRPSRPSSRTIGGTVEAGSHVVDTITYDGDTDRIDDAPQPNEQLVIEFLDAAGVVIAATGATPDLADSVEEATFSGTLGTVVLDRTATQIRAIHALAGVSTATANSLMPVCIGITSVGDPAPPPTPTVPTSTTVGATTSTVPGLAPREAPTPTTSVAASGTGDPPASSPTDQRSTVVASVQEAPTAVPTAVQPRFTG